MTDERDERMVLVAKALAHPARVRIVRLLASQTECRGQDVFSELPLAQSTVSQHLRVLKEAGLLKARPLGTSMVYCLVPSVFEEFHRDVGEITELAAACVHGQEGC